MKYQSLIKLSIILFVSFISSVVLASTYKYLYIFKGGNVVHSYNINDIDYIEIIDPQTSTSYRSAALIAAMIPTVAQGQENNYQMIDQMIGCEYGRMTSAKNNWGTGGMFACYNPPLGWQGIPFTTTMPQVYTPFFQIRDISGGEGLTYHWANLLRIFATLRISDCYGPTPFSKVGNGDSFQVEYDDMPDLFNAMLNEIDIAISKLKVTPSTISDDTFFALLTEFDYVYQGDFTKWVKFANTLKLRIAMRLVNANPTLAQKVAEECVNDDAGLIQDPTDAAWSTFIPGGNALHKVTVLWGEGAVSADITSYMNGYNDPRLPLYAKPARNGSYTGARSGVFNYPPSTFPNYSLTIYGAQDKLLSISASESWFMRAEGALRGWNMGGTAKELYEQGVQTSMKERGADIGNYLSSTATPADYVAIDEAAYNIGAASTICPAYDESASFETNLERIIVQKWLGNFPNGWESWADKRRTGYPKWFPVYNNLSNDGVTSAEGMQRIPFPQDEFNTNEANVRGAVQMLSGRDNCATKLWWAKK